MGPISLDAVSGNAYGSTASIGMIGGQSSPRAALATGAADQVASTSSITSMASMVQYRVDELLSSFGSQMSGDQQLRMIIALLILNALLGKDKDQPTNKAAELAGLAAGLDGMGRRSEVALFSATHIIQIQHQSTLVYTDQAVQTISGDQPAGQDPRGSSLDVTA